MCHTPRQRMDASLLVVATLPVTNQHPISTSRSWHEQQWIADDERLEIECINGNGGDDSSTMWMEMNGSPKSATSNRFFVAMILAAAVFRIRSI